MYKDEFKRRKQKRFYLFFYMFSMKNDILVEKLFCDIAFSKYKDIFIVWILINEKNYSLTLKGYKQ